MSAGRPRLILHIGQHKTGSKALQSFLAHNQAALRARGVLYPMGDLPSGGIRAYAISHYRLFALLRLEAIAECLGDEAAEQYGRQQAPFRAPFDSALAFLDWIEAERRRAGAGLVVLSAEDLFDMHTAHELAFLPRLIEVGARRLAGLASRLGYDARVVVYLRRQDHLLGAHYVQFIKGSPVHDLDFEVFTRAFGPRLDSRWILRRWAEAFGTDRTLVRRYEPDALPGGIVADVFEHVLGLPVPTGCETPPADAESVNRTLDRDFVEFIRILNRRTIAGQPVPDRAAVLEVALSGKVPSPTERGIAAWLPPSARRELLQACDEGNAAIARTFLQRADGRLFDEPWPEVADDWGPYPGLSDDRARTIAMAVHQAMLARQRRADPPETATQPPARQVPTHDRPRPRETPRN